MAIIDVPNEDDGEDFPLYERIVIKGDIYETPHYLKIRDQDGAHHFFKH